jgi:hypothetical protein
MSCTTSGPFGAFPNCDTLGASLFLNLVYGCGLLQAANLISDGSELLLEVLSPGLVGGLLLPILGAVPDAAVIVASGLGATQEEAQEQVSVGMGTLAGSTVMLLTVAWGGSLWVGRCDLDGFTGKAIQKQCSHGLADSFANTGVTVDGDTTLNARIMIASCLAFLAPQAAAFAGRGADGLADLVGAAVAFAGLAAYCAFQVLHPELQKRKIAAARLRQAKRYGAQIAHHIGLSVGGIVVDGDINAAALDRLFDQFDADGNGQIEVHELKAALVAMSVTMKDYNVSDADVAVWLREFDRDGDGLISRSEFCGGMTHWVLEQTRNAERRDADGASADERISTIREPSGVVSTRSQRRGLSLGGPPRRGRDGAAARRRGARLGTPRRRGVVRLGIRLGFGRGRGRGYRAPHEARDRARVGAQTHRWNGSDRRVRRPDGGRGVVAEPRVRDALAVLRVLRADALRLQRQRARFVPVLRREEEEEEHLADVLADLRRRDHEQHDVPRAVPGGDAREGPRVDVHVGDNLRLGSHGRRRRGGRVEENAQNVAGSARARGVPAFARARRVPGLRRRAQVSRETTASPG